MVIEIDSYPEENRVEVRVIHACVILENGLPFYQENKTTFNKARIVNGNSGTIAVVNSKAFENPSVTEVKNDEIYMVLPAQMTIIRNHYAEKVPKSEFEKDDYHPF